MKKLLVRTAAAGLAFLLIQVAGKAQEDNHSYSIDKKGPDEPREIIIRNKGDKNTKITIEIKNGKYFVNGKPLEKFDDGNISVIIANPEISRDVELVEPMAPMPPMPPINVSPFRDEDWRQAVRNNRSARRNSAFLGVACKESEKNGATVMEVTAGSAAEKAGLKKGDVITRIDDHKIDNPKGLTEVVHGYKPDQTVKIAYLRDGKEQLATATLQRMEREEAYSYNFGNMDGQFPAILNTDQWNHDAPRIGLRVQDAEDGKGVTVLDVDEASAAEKAGIKKGDVITALDGDTIEGAEDLADKVRDARTKPTVKASVLRNGSSQDIEIKVPRKLKKADL